VKELEVSLFFHIMSLVKGRAATSLERAIGTERRRSRRVPLSVPIYITSLDSSTVFWGHCNTIEVSRHGCNFFISLPFRRGTPLLLDIPTARPSAIIRCHVVQTMPASPDLKAPLWKVGVEFTQPGNFWNVASPPADWAS
jgi:PilZ domain-containing protein